MHSIGPEAQGDLHGEIITESISSDDSGHTTTIRQERSTLERTGSTTSDSGTATDHVIRTSVNGNSRYNSVGQYSNNNNGNPTSPSSWLSWLNPFYLFGTWKSTPKRPLIPINDDAIISNVLMHVSASGTGLMNKFYYRFQNIQLNKDKITVYYDPNEFEPPTEPYWIDMISGNISRPELPTVFVIKGDKVQGTKWFYLPIEYVSAADRQPMCTSWVNPLAYLLQVRYSYNIWHTWNEGLMGLFQTLRELGQLPLAAVGPNGELTEITDGMGADGCPWVYDFKTSQVMQQTRCPPRDGLLERDRCDPRVDPWCTEGAVVSVRRSIGGPIILPYTASSVVNIWSHLYSSMSSDVRDWSNSEGLCFKDLVVGKSSTLNFYQIVNGTEPDEAALEKYPRIDNLEARIEAMAVFKAFVTSAQREWAAMQLNKGQEAFKGYASAGMERLRRGIGPEDLSNGALNAMKLTVIPGMLREEMAELKRLWAKREAKVAHLVDEFLDIHGGREDALERAKERGYDPVEELEYYDDYEAIAAKKMQESVLRGQGGGKLHGDDGLRRKKRRRKRTLLSSSFTASEQHRTQSRSRALLQHHSKWFDKSAVFRHETPRPVVTYMSRNFFSRGVLNEQDILGYILSRYNVTLKVTTFEEPLLYVMDLLSASDVMFGMHGAGWTNALFIKRGATTMQMFPYGWRLPDNSTVRGFNYREIVYASECPYMEWVNPVREHAFFRRIDFPKKKDEVYSLHPDPAWPLPNTSWPGNPWICTLSIR